MRIQFVAALNDKANTYLSMTKYLCMTKFDPVLFVIEEISKDFIYRLVDVIM